MPIAMRLAMQHRHRYRTPTDAAGFTKRARRAPRGDRRGCGRVGREPFFRLTAVYCGNFFQIGKFLYLLFRAVLARNYNKNRRDRRFLPVTAVTWPRAVAKFRRLGPRGCKSSIFLA